MTPTTSLWFLSFADRSRPKGNQVLGVAIVEAADFDAALRVSWATGCNPGGEVPAGTFYTTAQQEIELFTATGHTVTEAYQTQFGITPRRLQ